MTLTEFRATGRDCELQSCEHAVSQDMTGPGRVYVDGLFIEGTPDHYTLTIGNQTMTGEQATLEEKLYAFAVSEGYIDGCNHDADRVDGECMKCNEAVS